MRISGTYLNLQKLLDTTKKIILTLKISKFYNNIYIVMVSTIIII